MIPTLAEFEAIASADTARLMPALRARALRTAALMPTTMTPAAITLSADALRIGGDTSAGVLIEKSEMRLRAKSAIPMPSGASRQRLGAGLVDVVIVTS